MRLALLAGLLVTALPALAQPPDCEEMQTWQRWAKTPGVLPPEGVDNSCRDTGKWSCTAPRGYKPVRNPAGEMPAGSPGRELDWIKSGKPIPWGFTLDFDGLVRGKVQSFKARIMPHCHPHSEPGNHAWHRGFTTYVSTAAVRNPPTPFDVRGACQKADQGYNLFSWMAERAYGEFAVTCTGFSDKKVVKGREARANVVGEYRLDGFLFHGRFDARRLRPGAKCRAVFTGFNILDQANGQSGRSDEFVCPN
jgi:hypothetical protein